MGDLFQSVTIQKSWNPLHVVTNLDTLAHCLGSDEVPEIVAWIDTAHLIDVEPCAAYKKDYYLYRFHLDDGTIAEHICTDKELSRFMSSL